MDFNVENIRCGGCVNTITKKIKQEYKVEEVNVDIETQIISINVDESQESAVYESLLALGYPKANSVSGFSSVKAKTKSFVSCAIGKV